MSIRTKLAILVAVVALGSLALGLAFREDDYAMSLLVGLGTTLALAFPLFWLEHKFEERVTTEVQDRVGEVRKATDESLGQLSSRLEEVQSSVGDIGDRVADLDHRMQERADERREERRARALDPILPVAEDGSFRTIFEALRHSANSGATERKVFVPLKDERVSLRFVPTSEPESIVITVIPDGFRPKTVDHHWGEGQTIDDALLELDETLQEKGGDAAPRVYAAGSIRDHLLKTLAEAQERLLRKGADSQPPPVLELVTAHWLITTRTLEHLREPVTFELPRVLTNDEPPAGQPDEDELPYAWAMANARFKEN